MTLFTRFDPAKVKPVGDVVKGAVSMHAEAGGPREAVFVVGGLHLRPPHDEGGTATPGC